MPKGSSGVIGVNHAERNIFDESHDIFRNQVRRFYAAEIEPNIGAWEKVGRFDRDIFRKAGAAGILCPQMPERYGGGGGDALHLAICYEEHGYSLGGASMDSGLDSDAAAYIILLGGTEAQKLAWLPRFASGEIVGEGMFTEASSGSDLNAMATTATRDGDGWLINGSKMWVTNASHLDLCILIARVEQEEAARPSFGVLLIDADASGVTRSKPIETMLRGCGDLGQIFFDNVRVGPDRLLGGAIDRGFRQAVQALTLTRTLYAARSVASCELALSMALTFTKERQSFGRRLFDMQVVREKLATIRMRIDVARAFVDKCLLAARDGRLTAERSSMAKLWCTEMEVEVSDICAHLHGAMGYSNEHPISKIVAAARGHRYAMGVSEMQLEAVMRSL